MITAEEQFKLKKHLEYADLDFNPRTVLSAQSGLCLTCVHQKVCSLTNSKSVIECDDFISEEVNRVKFTGKAVKQRAVVDVPPIHKEKNYQGLCVNCESRNNCSSSAVKGGIWFCEEYC